MKAESVGVSTSSNMAAGTRGAKGCVESRFSDQSQYGRANCGSPLSSRQICSNQPTYPRCQTRNHQLPCGQSRVWTSDCRYQLRGSLGGSASIARIAFL